jgi:hypothetical protein
MVFEIWMQKQARPIKKPHRFNSNEALFLASNRKTKTKY